MQHAHDAFRGLLGGDALDGQRHDAPRPLLAFLPGLRLEVPEQDRRLALALVLDLLDQLGLGLGRVQTGRPFEDQPPLFGHVIELGSLAGDAGVELGQLTVALLDPSLLGVQPLLALGQPVLAALQVRSQLTDVLFEGARLGLGATAGFQRRRAGGKLGVPAQSLGVGLGSAANRQRLELGRMSAEGPESWTCLVVVTPVTGWPVAPARPARRPATRTTTRPATATANIATKTLSSVVMCARTSPPVTTVLRSPRPAQSRPEGTTGGEHADIDVRGEEPQTPRELTTVVPTLQSGTSAAAAAGGPADPALVRCAPWYRPGAAVSCAVGR